MHNTTHPSGTNRLSFQKEREKEPLSKNPSYVLKSLLAGGLAGCTAKTIIGPFDRVKILFQVKSPAIQNYSGKISGVFKAISYVFKHDGFYGLYRGHSVMLLRIFPYSGTNFMAFEQYKRILMPNEKERDVRKTSWKKLIAGSMSGATAVLVTYPFDIMRARLAYHLSSHHEAYIHLTTVKAKPLDNSHHFLYKFLFGQVGRPLSLQSGWRPTFTFLLYDGKPGSDQSILSLIRNLYRGLTPTLLGIIPYAGVSFYTFESLKSISLNYLIKDEGQNELPVSIKFICGLIAGALGQTCAYPLDIVRRRMQLDKVASHLPQYTSVGSAIMNIYKSQGLKGLFIGLSINYIKVAPSTAISFVTYEFLKKQLNIT